jgi:hypothetical protein
MESQSQNEEAMRGRIAWLNAGTAALVCLILLFSWLFAKHLFDYARERVNYYLYETYMSGLGSGFGRQQLRQPEAQSGLRGFSAPPQRRPERQAEYEFKTEINPYQLGLYAAWIFACSMGIVYLSSKKQKWRKDYNTKTAGL